MQKQHFKQAESTDIDNQKAGHIECHEFPGVQNYFV